MQGQILDSLTKKSKRFWRHTNRFHCSLFLQSARSSKS